MKYLLKKSNVIFLISLLFMIYFTSCEKEKKLFPISKKYKNVLSEYDTIVFKNNFEQYRKYKVSKVKSYFKDPLDYGKGQTKNEFYEYYEIGLDANSILRFWIFQSSYNYNNDQINISDSSFEFRHTIEKEDMIKEQYNINGFNYYNLVVMHCLAYDSSQVNFLYSYKYGIISFTKKDTIWELYQLK
ncbi:MAG: hypothetical protein A2X12_06865 [Bacteroidetes bacterium GWE2_29_8]|nr:MAG: hypothetical protein A2X12_06865 [Bacteroidetes bacterium GWE2_29_8]OFY21183.1 MAG: hypothetical protein A2X02_10210 [Bacteroidetes bacterium GWF2_29_10]